MSCPLRPPDEATSGIYNITMGVTQLVSVDEYLKTEYDPDCDYVDGEVLERNLGERDHGELQGEIYAYFKELAKVLRIRPFIEQRLQIGPSRFRVPDVCLVAGARPREQVFTRAPLVVIEILSAEDRMSRMQQKIDDYLTFGVQHIWLVDPKSRRAWVCSADGMREAKDGILRTANPAIELALPKIFSAIDSNL